MKGNVLHALGVVAVGLFLLGAGPRGPARVGVVLPGEQWQSGVDGLREGLRARGHVEGRDIQILEHVRRHGALSSYGSSVGRLPIERGEVHELILNLDTAVAIGVRFGQEALSRADAPAGKRSTR